MEFDSRELGTITVNDVMFAFFLKSQPYGKWKPLNQLRKVYQIHKASRLVEAFLGYVDAISIQQCA